MPFVVVTEHWPVVVSTLPERIDEKELERFIATHDALLARSEPYVTITDCTTLREVPGATVRKRLGDWTKHIEPRIRSYNIATAIVVGSPLVRGALTALHWIAPPPQPTHVVGTVREGVPFVLEALARRGIVVSPSVRRYCEALGTGAERTLRP